GASFPREMKRKESKATPIRTGRARGRTVLLPPELRSTETASVGKTIPGKSPSLENAASRGFQLNDSYDSWNRDRGWLLDKDNRLGTGNVKTPATALTHQHIVNPDQVIARLLKPHAV